MDPINKIAKMGLGRFDNRGKLKCRAFEDNKEVLELTMVPKIQPRTRHISAAIHTSRVTVCGVDTNKQDANIFIKPLDKNQFQYL